MGLKEKLEGSHQKTPLGQILTGKIGTKTTLNTRMR